MHGLAIKMIVNQPSPTRSPDRHQLHNAHRVEIKGDSMRRNSKLKGLTPRGRKLRNTPQINDSDANDTARRLSCRELNQQRLSGTVVKSTVPVFPKSAQLPLKCAASPVPDCFDAVPNTSCCARSKKRPPEAGSGWSIPICQRPMSERRRRPATCPWIRGRASMSDAPQIAAEQPPKAGGCRRVFCGIRQAASRRRPEGLDHVSVPSHA